MVGYMAAQKTIKELFDFSGKTVVVTGAAKGIGFAVASRFHEAGANVVISDVDDAVGGQKAKRLGARCRYVHADVSAESEVQALAGAAEIAGKRIRVNAIAPGGISTEGVEEMTKGAVKAGDTQSEMIRQFTARIPLGRFGVPDEIATVALFLASDAASYMTGSMVVADGGYLLS